MNTKKCFLCALILMCTIMLQAQTSNPVGAIPGVIDVSPMGAATYTIPIEVVPGTQGMQPNLSITYNSFGGMGLLGMKWNLTGLSAITRCGQIPYYDSGNITAIQFTENDRFTLDGERLVFITNQPQVEYGTEIENFTRIIKHTSNAITSHFIAYTDDGRIIEYGNTPDSKQQLGSTISSTLSWLVKKITDANGNEMVFSYGNQDGEVWINSIQYSKNTDISNYASVLFDYTAIPEILDRNTCFVKGEKVIQTKLLETIWVFYGNTRVRKYKFNYDHTGEQSVHLKSIVLYGETDSQQQNATTITWGNQNSYQGQVPIKFSDNSSFPDGNILPGDFNGDGYMDFVLYGLSNSQKIWQLNTGNANLTFDKGVTGSHKPVSNCMFYKADITGDGSDNLIIAEALNADWRHYHFSILSLKNDTVILIDTATVGWLHQVLFGDFNGDGKTDMLFVKKDYYNNCSFQFYMNGSIYSPLGLPSLNLPCNVRVGDFNGDGKTDVELNYYYNKLYTCYFNNATHVFGYDLYPQQTAEYSYDRYSGDFNGDGITDLLTFEPPENGNGYVWKVYFGKGDKSYTNVTIINDRELDTNFDLEEGRIVPKRKILIADLDGDGKDDIIQLTGSQMSVLYSRGCVFYPYQYQNPYKYLYQPKKVSISGSNLTECKTYNISDFNNDGILDVIVQGTREAIPGIYCLHKNNQYEFSKIITDGMGKIIEMVYKPKYWMAEDQNATKKYFYHLLDNLKISNGVNNGLNTIKYIYDAPVFSRLKRTFLGFKQFSCINNQENKKEVFEFAHNSSNNLMKPVSQTIYFNNSDWNITTYDFSFKSVGNQRYMPYSNETTVLDKLNDKKTVITTTVHNNGRVKTRNTKTYDGCTNNTWIHSEIKTYTYQTISLSGNQFKTVPTQILTTQQYGSLGVVTADTLSFGYFPASNKGRLSWEKKSNVHGAITTYYLFYLSSGVYNLKAVSAVGCITRHEMYEFDNTQRFTTKVTNAADHITTFTYDGKTGNKLKETDPNGLATTYKYDTFGNLTQINYPGGTKTNISLKWHTGGNPVNAKYYTTTTTSGKPELIVYYDILGREVCRNEDGYFYQTVYNAIGQVEKTSGPFQNFNEPDIIWNTYSYDEFGRKTTEKAPYLKLKYDYDNRKVTVTDSLRGNIKSWKNYDALGRIIEAKDEGGNITYDYTVTSAKRDSVTIKHNGMVITTFSTDLWGNRLLIKDANAGLITSTYNKFNELEKQVDARGNITTCQYDLIGRIKRKTCSELGVSFKFIDYIYDNAQGKGIGKLSQIKSNNVEAEVFTYDKYSRLSEHKKIIDATPYVHKYSYNTNGQLDTLTYPDNFAVKYKYTTTGKLEEIRNANDNKAIYKVDSRNKFNAPTCCEYGNRVITDYTYNQYGLLTRIKTGNKITGNMQDPGGNRELGVNPSLPYTVDSAILNYRYTYNDKGLMVSRSESVFKYFEQFGYDNLDRLTQITTSNAGNPGILHSFYYTNNGNILYSPEGSYKYNSSGKPHAVLQVGPSNYVIPQTVTYNFNNQPIEITKVASALLSKRLEIFYDVNQQRQKTVEYLNNGIEDTHFYISKYYEKKTNTSNVATCYNYIYGDNEAVALRMFTPSTDSMYYIHTDHLGSYCVLTSPSGQVVQSQRFDPWGNQYFQIIATNPNDSITSHLPGDSLQPPPTDFGSTGLNFPLICRGFTGHEHYPEFKIINMNSRLYDPVIARFFSPDNYVQIPEFSQSFNRYSYCLNNPLKYVDPSGNLYWKPDQFGHAIAEDGDDEYSLAKALGITTEKAVQMLKDQGYINEQGISNLVTGNKVVLENPFVKSIAAHGNLLYGDPKLNFNCWGSTWSGINGIEISVENEVGISQPYTFDKRLEKFFTSISPEEAVHGKTAIRFTTDTPYSNKSDWDAIPGTFSKNPDARGGALHGVVFYMRSNDGTVYVYTKDGWGFAPQIIKLSDIDSNYGSVRGLNGQSGYYLLKLK